jgi:hypothetical protein
VAAATASLPHQVLVYKTSQQIINHWPVMWQHKTLATKPHDRALSQVDQCLRGLPDASAGGVALEDRWIYVIEATVLHLKGRPQGHRSRRSLTAR